MEQYFIYKFKNKEYKISKNKITFLLSCLTGKKFDNSNNYQIIKYLKKFKLLNDDFLKKFTE